MLTNAKIPTSTRQQAVPLVTLATSFSSEHTTVKAIHMADGRRSQAIASLLASPNSRRRLLRVLRIIVGRSLKPVNTFVRLRAGRRGKQPQTLA